MRCPPQMFFLTPSSGACLQLSYYVIYLYIIFGYRSSYIKIKILVTYSLSVLSESVMNKSFDMWRADNATDIVGTIYLVRFDGRGVWERRHATENLIVQPPLLLIQNNWIEIIINCYWWKANVQQTLVYIFIRNAGRWNFPFIKKKRMDIW